MAKDSSITSSLQKIINIQLFYDINQVTEYDSWDRIFHPISLYSALEHLPYDTKNIKELLHHMNNYIKNKNIESNKINNVLDLKGISEVAWSFISAIYKSE